MKRALLIGVLALSVLLAISSCTPVGPSPAPAGSTAASTQAAPTAASTQAVTTALPAAPTAAPAQTAAVQLVGTPEVQPATPAAEVALSTTATVAGPTPELPALKLSALTSYVASIEMSDEPVTATAQSTAQPPVKMEMRYRGVPTPEEYAWTTSGQHAGDGATQDLKVLLIGQNMYIFEPTQNKWVQMPGANTQNLPLKQDLVDPNRLAQVTPAGLFSKENMVSQHEMVDGVDTTHYKANASQVGALIKDAGDEQRTAVSGTADFWVENASGYLKQYVMVANLKDKQGQEYKRTIKYTLTNENKPIDIATPAPSDIVTMEQLQQMAATALPPQGTPAQGTPSQQATPSPQATP